VELRLAGEQPTEREPIEAADEFAVLSHLDRVRHPEAVECAVGRGDGGGDPRAVTARVGAGGDNVVERGVDAHLHRPARATQAAGDVEVTATQDAALQRRPPAERFAAALPQTHREDALGVRPDDRRRFEVGAEGDEVVIGVEVGVGEVPPALELERVHDRRSRRRAATSPAAASP